MDEETGLGVQAQVDLLEGAWPLQTGPEGRFGRPVTAGPWTAEVRAPGFAAQTVELGTEGPTLVHLIPEADVALRPHPALLSQSGAGRFVLQDDASSVRLVRAGEEPVVAAWTADGWQVDPVSMRPGPWTLQVDDQAAPNALFIGERDDAVEITEVDWDLPSLHLTGHDFGTGTRAWVASGPRRSWVPVPVLHQNASTIELDGAAFEGMADPLDLVLLTAGRQLVALDVRADGVVDTGAPAIGDTGTPDTDSGQAHTPTHKSTSPPGCACSASDPTALWSMLAPIILIARRRV